MHYTQLRLKFKLPINEDNNQIHLQLVFICN